MFIAARNYCKAFSKIGKEKNICLQSKLTETPFSARIKKKIICKLSNSKKKKEKQNASENSKIYLILSIHVIFEYAKK